MDILPLIMHPYMFMGRAGHHALVFLCSDEVKTTTMQASDANVVLAKYSP